MVAGEPSGDLLASLLLRSMKQRWTQLRSFGIGGDAMLAQGFESWWSSERLAVRGYLEVLPRYPELLHMRRQLGTRLLIERPELFIGIDAPDFNLDLELRLREGGLKTLHFVSPSFWAWRPEKLDKLRRAADMVLCIFPFEAPQLQARGIAARYVGHPLASVIPMKADAKAARRGLGLDEDGEYVALLPGSRAAEISHLAGRFLETAGRLTAQRPGLRFVLPAIPSHFNDLQASVASAGMSGSIKVFNGQSHAALAACDVALVASGTATLEAALFKRPMVIAYRMNWLSWKMLQGRNQQAWIGLPNILCGDSLVPELLQDEASPQALAREVLDWFHEPERVTNVRLRFDQLHLELQRDTGLLATEAIAELCA